MDPIALSDEASIEINHVTGHIHLRVEDGDAYTFVAIKPHHFDAIEARWGDARTQLDAYRQHRAEQAIAWLEERGHRTVRDLVHAGRVDVEAVLTDAAQHASAIERLRATAPAAVEAVDSQPGRADTLRQLGNEGDDHANHFLRQVFMESLTDGSPDAD